MIKDRFMNDLPTLVSCLANRSVEQVIRMSMMCVYYLLAPEETGVRREKNSCDKIIGRSKQRKSHGGTFSLTRLNFCRWNRYREIIIIQISEIRENVQLQVHCTFSKVHQTFPGIWLQICHITFIANNYLWKNPLLLPFLIKKYGRVCKSEGLAIVVKFEKLMCRKIRSHVGDVLSWGVFLTKEKNERKR
jgi:hypothetical protein